MKKFACVVIVLFAMAFAFVMGMFGARYETAQNETEIYEEPKEIIVSRTFEEAEKEDRVYILRNYGLETYDMVKALQEEEPNPDVYVTYYKEKDGHGYYSWMDKDYFVQRSENSNWREA